MAVCSKHSGARKPKRPSRAKANTFIYHLGKTGQGGFHRESQDQGSKKSPASAAEATSPSARGPCVSSTRTSKIFPGCMKAWLHMPCLGRPGGLLQSPGCWYCFPSPVPPCSCPSSILLGQRQVKIVGFLTGALLGREDSPLLGIPSLWPLQTGAPVTLAPSPAVGSGEPWLYGICISNLPCSFPWSPQETSRLCRFPCCLLSSLEHHRVRGREGRKSAVLCGLLCVCHLEWYKL